MNSLPKCSVVTSKILRPQSRLPTQNPQNWTTTPWQNWAIFHQSLKHQRRQNLASKYRSAHWCAQWTCPRDRFAFNVMQAPRRYNSIANPKARNCSLESKTWIGSSVMQQTNIIIKAFAEELMLLQRPQSRHTQLSGILTPKRSMLTSTQDHMRG